MFTLKYTEIRVTYSQFSEFTKSIIKKNKKVQTFNL